MYLQAIVFSIPVLSLKLHEPKYEDMLLHLSPKLVGKLSKLRTLFWNESLTGVCPLVGILLDL